jgi:hypothetical protein
MKTGRSSRLRILVLGYLVRGPIGGLAWHHLQYVLGLARLGHEVYFLEESEDYESCYHPATGQMNTDPAYGLRFAARVFGRLELADQWAYHDAHTRQWMGPCAHRMPGLCESAELLLNLSGVNPLRPWMLGVPVRALIDTDPVFTQIAHLTEPLRRARAQQHTVFFSFAENFGRPDCSVPEDGLAWQPTRQPVVLDAWPVTPGPAGGRFTTVMQWDSYPAREWNGVRYGMKSESFKAFFDLPARTGARFELVLGSPRAPRTALRENGWVLRGPHARAGDPWVYQRYLQRSKAEFSAAKNGYVVSRSGWFSERSTGYLASGRPVVVQETGFSRWLPAGLGLVPFSSPAEAVAGIESVDGHYAEHCRAARAIAEEYFDAGKVLSRLLDRAARSPARPNEPPERRAGTGQWT